MIQQFVRFNAVGILGVAVQLAVLRFCTQGLGVQYVTATVVAVEIALLHNFCWHEVWIWKSLPWQGWPVRLVRFQLGNGVISIASNAALTFAFHEFMGLPVLAANLAAILISALLNFRVARFWVFRGMFIVALLGATLNAAVFTTTLQPATIAAWNDYIERFEHTSLASRPMLDPRGDQPLLIDLNPGGSIPDGYIHHWIGAMRIPNVAVAQVRSVIEDYSHWQQIYKPDVKFALATRVSPADYNLRMISEQTDGLLHFAFDMHFRVQFHQAGDFQLAESRSYLIRESDSGHAPYTDLLSEGSDHGILWRLNTYWRLKPAGTSTYAECQVLSLSRKPVLGTTGHVKARARDSLKATLTATAQAARANL